MGFKAQAPGSLMLLGEYAVLYGKPALVCALNKTITVTVNPRHDNKIHIHSEQLGTHVTDLTSIQLVKPFEFTLSVFKHMQKKLRHGCDVYINADFSHQIGFGSSAAVTVATIAALNTWIDIQLSPNELVQHAHKVIKDVQTTGSGADVAASVYGGIIAYQINPLVIEKFMLELPLTIVYSGYKTPTPIAIKTVENNFADHPETFEKICAAIGTLAKEGINAVRAKNINELGRIMNAQQQLMHELGVNDPKLQSLIDELLTDKRIAGAKISGAGMGDCVIGIGAELSSINNSIPASISLNGVTCEEI